MPRFEQVRPDVAEDVLRIHRLVTRALQVSVEQSAAYVRNGYPDDVHRKGLYAYVRCLATLLHAHHVTEDESVFPYFGSLLPDVPYETLTAQHHAMDPVLDEIKAALDRSAGALDGVGNAEQDGLALESLHHSLDQMNVLWHAHIAQEERYLSPERIGAVIDDHEQARLSRVFAREGRKHQMGVVPLYWLVPFLLYNLRGPDRQWMEAQMPSPRLSWVVTGVLLPWIWSKWAPMAPLLLYP